MNQIARCDWLPERARSCPCPLGTTRCIQHEKFPRKPYNKSFIDQVCSVKMAGYWPRSFFFFASLWTSTSSRSINTEKRTWPIFSHLDRTNLVNNPFLFPSFSWGIFGHVTCLDQSRPRENIGSNKNQNIKLLPQNLLPTEIFCHCPFLEPPRIK